MEHKKPVIVIGNPCSPTLKKHLMEQYHDPIVVIPPCQKRETQQRKKELKNIGTYCPTCKKFFNYDAVFCSPDCKENYNKSCPHDRAHYEPWPDGGEVEVCDSCGYSRSHWEQGCSNWIHIDVELSRKELQHALDSLDKTKGMEITYKEI